MKDKLEKTGRRKPYYRLVNALRGAGFSLLALIALATPVFIAFQVDAAETYAQEVPSTEDHPDDPVIVTE